jgi:D-mannonate dehydratase
MRNDALFIIRIKSNWKWDENYRIATRYGPVRVVCFGSIEQKVDDYLATNIPEEVTSNGEIAAAYRRAIEVLAQFSLFICCCNYMPTARLRL